MGIGVKSILLGVAEMNSDSPDANKVESFQLLVGTMNNLKKFTMTQIALFWRPLRGLVTVPTLSKLNIIATQGMKTCTISLILVSNSYFFERLNWIVKFNKIIKLKFSVHRHDGDVKGWNTVKLIVCGGAKMNSDCPDAGYVGNRREEKWFIIHRCIG